MQKFEAYKRAFSDIRSIIFRHVFLLVNAVIFSVVVLLFIFGNREAAIFIGAILFINIAFGIAQDTRARIALEALEIATAIRNIRINKDGSETSVLPEEIQKGDHIKIKLGDQVSCDGALITGEGLEVSRALLTGESDSFPKAVGEKVSSGDIVTAGWGIFEVEKIFHESKIFKMTEEAKRYSAAPSPIELSVRTIIKYSGYILLAIIAFVLVRGFYVHEPLVQIVLNIGALASIIVPQGLVVFTTLFFAFGAMSYSSHHVLFQEINATEKLGRIKNLCMDKTGTLTENILVVEDMFVPNGISKETARELAAFYSFGLIDSTQTIEAIKKYFGKVELKRKIINILPFSSWRQYGAVEIEGENGKETIVVGSPDIFISHLQNEEEKNWLDNLIKENSHKGKRILCVARSQSPVFSREISGTSLSLVAVFVFQSGFREGIKDAVEFFQNRGIQIRIISGDNPETVRAIAASAGVNHSDSVITGPEIKNWNEKEFNERVSQYTIFARILPEQKVKIINAFKKNGFTAMVGDGANDALAIKNADLGIAMFDGAAATRRLAGVILMNNSFSALPGAVELADNFIHNIELYAGIFTNQSFIGLFLFIALSILNYSFPLTPLNITFINYLTIGIPGILIVYWALRPSGKIPPANSQSFLKRVLPFVAYNALIEAIGVSIIFAFSPAYLKTALSNTLVIIAFAASGFLFFILALKAYRSSFKNIEWKQIFLALLAEIAFIFFIFKTPLLAHFFNLTTPYPSITYIFKTLFIVLIFGFLQYLIAATKLIKIKE